jgi:hypothetical protein
MLRAVNRTHMALVGAFFGAAFAISGVLRGNVAPALVGGALGAVLVFLVLQRVHEHNEAVRRRREDDDSPRAAG